MSIDTPIMRRIVSMQAGLTKGSQSPMWRCVCHDGERVNVFRHTDPQKNNFALFEQAGYAYEMNLMQDGEELHWHNFPIAVKMTKNGQWNEVVGVEPRPVGANPDPSFVPDPALYREMAQQWARGLLTHDAVYLDTETTDVNSDDEIISIAAMNGFGLELLNTFIKPQALSRVERHTDVHHITLDMLEDAPTFPEVYGMLADVLSGEIWVIYNADFDVRMLEQNCIRHGLPPIPSVGINCAMKMFSKFYGEWDVQRQEFKYKTLGFAADHMNLVTEEAHEALADAMTTLHLVRAISLVAEP